MYLQLLEPADEFFVVEKSLGAHLHLPDHDKSELLDAFVVHAERPVNEGRYSLKRLAGEWKFVPFDREDLQLIDEALHSS